jgi:hypothetical protein
LKKVEPAVFESWAAEARSSAAWVSGLEQGRQLDCLALCHATAPGAAPLPVKSANDCQAQASAVVYALAVRSYSMIERWICCWGASDAEHFHFSTRLDEKHKFDVEAVIPAKPGRAGPICVETEVPILPQDIVFEQPVRIVSEIKVFVPPNNHDWTTSLELTLVPEAG